MTSFKSSHFSVEKPNQAPNCGVHLIGPNDPPLPGGPFRVHYLENREAVELARSILEAAIAPAASRCPRCHHVAGVRNPEGCAMCNPERLGDRLTEALSQLSKTKLELGLTLATRTVWPFHVREAIASGDINQCIAVAKSSDAFLLGMQDRMIAAEALAKGEGMNTSLQRIANALDAMVGAEKVVKKAFDEVKASLPPDENNPDRACGFCSTPICEHIGRIVDRAEIRSAAIPMLLSCPCCHARHIDTGTFAVKQHHTHACQFCGVTWRPAIVDTVGVQFLPGFKDSKG